MTDLVPLTALRRSSSATSERSLRYEEIFNNPNIVNEGYTTFDEHSSEEEAPTQRRIRPRPEGLPHAIGPQLSSVATTELEDSSAPIFSISFGDQRRARYGDIEAGSPEIAPQPQPAAIQIANTPGRTGDEPRVFEIMHNWTQGLRDEEFVANINVVERPAAEADQISSVRGHIGWLHAEEYRPNLEKLELLFSTYLAPGLASQIRETTIRLLKRVKASSERKYVGGKFLIPGPIRYDARLSPNGDDDHPCTFFSFPYLAVGEFEKKSKSKAKAMSARQRPTGQGYTVGHSNQQMRNMISGDSSQPPNDLSIHPVRMLLQSRYRLESTKKRDDNQSITGLLKEDVRDCIRLPPDTRDVVKGNKWKRKIYVPQFWGLSISGDTMITSGPISEIDLRSSALMTKTTTLQGSQSHSGPSIIRINLEYESRREPFIYPVDRCDWYFGLVNQERRILSTLSSKTDKQNSIKSKLYSKEGSTEISDLITSENWIEVLRSHTSEVLDLWMVRESPQIEVTADSADDQTLDKDVTNSPSSPLLKPRSPEDTSKTLTVIQTSSTLLRVPSHRRNTSHSSGNSSTTSHGTTGRLTTFMPFLQWPMEEDEGKDPGRKASERVRLWLDKVLATTLQYHGNDVDNSTPEDANAAPGKSPNRRHGSSFAPIRRSSRGKVQERLFGVNNSPSQPISTGDAIRGDLSQEAGQKPRQPAREVEQLFVSARRILKVFVPEKFPLNESPDDTWTTAEHDLVCIYWGLQDRIVESVLAQQLHATELTKLLKSMSDIIGLAELLHRGVRKYKIRHDDGTDLAKEMVNVDSVVVQRPIPIALEHIMQYLFDVAKYVSGRSSATPLDPTAFSRAVGRHLKRALDDLTLAQDYLIAAADENTFGKGLGPVVTAEAIILLLLERLSRGVYKNGTIDVMDLYEKVVEKLASQVEHDASRHLLLEINRVSEELEIILDVLKQQKKFFTLYRELLDPARFDPPTLKRRSRFPFEKNSINRNIKAVDERIGDCTELQKRANRLADQNVRLVETYQDDNNKTLLIFTVVTITFLPLSFVTGFFGMNVQGITGTTSTVKHFWVIAVPVTVGVVIFSLILAYWGPISRKWTAIRKWVETNRSRDD